MYDVFLLLSRTVRGYFKSTHGVSVPKYDALSKTGNGVSLWTWTPLGME